MQRYFGVGSVVVDNRESDTMKYHVTNRNDLLSIIVPFFGQYKLVTSKYLNFRDFSDALKSYSTLPADKVNAHIFLSFEKNGIYPDLLKKNWSTSKALGL